MVIQGSSGSRGVASAKGGFGDRGLLESELGDIWGTFQPKFQMGAGLQRCLAYSPKVRVSLSCNSLNQEDLQAQMDNMQNMVGDFFLKEPDITVSDINKLMEESMPIGREIMWKKQNEESVYNMNEEGTHFSRGVKKVLDIGEEPLHFSYTHAGELRNRLSQLTINQRCDCLLLLHGQIFKLAWEITIGHSNNKAHLAEVLSGLLNAKQAYEEKYKVVLGQLYSDCACEKEELWDLLRNHSLHGIQKRWEQLEINC